MRAKHYCIIFVLSNIIYRVTHFNFPTGLSWKECIFWKKVSDIRFSIFPWLFNDNIEFDLECECGGHLKVKLIFLNGNHYFLSQIWKERKISRPNMTLIMIYSSMSRSFQSESSRRPLRQNITAGLLCLEKCQMHKFQYFELASWWWPWK